MDDFGKDLENTVNHFKSLYEVFEKIQARGGVFRLADAGALFNTASTLEQYLNKVNSMFVRSEQQFTNVTISIPFLERLEDIWKKALAVAYSRGLMEEKVFDELRRRLDTIVVFFKNDPVSRVSTLLETAAAAATVDVATSTSKPIDETLADNV